MKHILLAIFALLISIFPHIALADEWGCEVLLCAASSNPSWHGVPECRPPMDRLISAMKKSGFSWPTCPEGGAGKPGFEAFANCPAGWSATEGEASGGFSRSELSRCTRTVKDCRGGRRPPRGFADNDRIKVERDGITWVHRDGWNCEYTEYMARRRREQPYFFDILDQSTKAATRFYFDLRN